MTRAVLRELRRIRRRVAGGASVFEAWAVLWQERRKRRATRNVLRRHVIPGAAPFDALRNLFDGDHLSRADALAWVDAAIAYAERELRGEV